MNRKQRRAQGQSGGGSPSRFAAAPALAGKPAEIFAAAVAHHGAGRFAEAERGYRQVLASLPNHAEAQGRIGAVLAVQGKISEAISHLERAVALKPDQFETLSNLAQAYLAAGQGTAAASAAGRALELRETPAGRTLFAHCVRYAQPSLDDAGLRKWLLRALVEGWARPRELVDVCIRLIKLNGAVSGWAERADTAWPERLAATDLSAPSGIAALAADELLTCLLEFDPIADLGLERLLTDIRSAMLAMATGDAPTGDEPKLKFFAAIARQCFINEYVYALPADEQEHARGLQSELAHAIADGAAIPALWPIAVGAYVPLYAVPGADALLARAWPQAVEALLVQQIKQPAREHELAAAMPVLTAIDDEVSRAVRRQYEENPYPRWVKGGPPLEAMATGAKPQGQGQAPDVLIAGCGTGLSTVEFARQMPGARILAIDLSLASLSYAKRMAQSFGLANVEFAHADLTRLGGIERRFDFIDASGVLHHLADPWAGWKVLLALLRAGGTMQVGLYSELARRNVVAARALIAERGFAPGAQDIRRCRDYIATAEDPLLKSLTKSADFFTTGECRDLLFHVQEHRITLPQIKSFLAANGVEFAGFLPQPSIMRAFVARFPDRAALLDLDCWHSFETEAPETFAAMYQFWVRKPATDTSGIKPR